jgi:molybdopterin-guanine dinucleotide biosynthesis adapter protein
MVPIIGLTGRSKVGKTTMAVKLMEELKRRGYRLAAIKHTAHQVEFDRAGKDTDLMYRTGAEAVALASLDQLGMYMSAAVPWTPAEIAARLFPQVDLVLVEGYSGASMPRIGLLRQGVAEDLPTRKGLIAVVADFKVDFSIPTYSYDQVAEIADLLEQYIKRQRGKRDVTLFVNGKPIFIKPFVKDFILKPIAGMVGALKGGANAQRIQIVIDQPEGEAEEEESER